jgi:GTP 3',8-cyclase
MSSSKVIFVADQRHTQIPLVPPSSAPNTFPLIDTLGRPLRDLRISVTDRCNFRCSYCMPKVVFNSEHTFLPQSALLSFEEITRLARIFVAMGVQKIRITGGEPLLRKNLERLIGMLSQLRTPLNEKIDLTLTTNASVLARKALALKEAGLQRLTVSLDAIDDAVFRQMNDADYPVKNVLDGLIEAQKVGLGPIKVNMVVKRGTNDHQILPMAQHFRGTPVVLRFIEYMDVGSTNGWRMDEVLPSSEVIRQIHAVHPLQALPANQAGETATRFRYQDGAGEVGVISSVTQAFCHDCNRARLSTEGQLFTCLFASRGHDLRSLLRNTQVAHTDAQIAAAIGPLWAQRSDRYSELRGITPATPSEARRVEMHYIGG